ncbi:MAG: hypothetical protein RQ758_02500 [Methanomicrobiaceae archaeon]|nr:hypothetical protein [Methanomicrobiaceae archaeon]
MVCLRRIWGQGTSRQWQIVFFSDEHMYVSERPGYFSRVHCLLMRAAVLPDPEEGSPWTQR